LAKPLFYVGAVGIELKSTLTVHKLVIRLDV
jgi:hypothetical protein